MEKDDNVGDSAPHIANIGRLVEVRGSFVVSMHLQYMCYLHFFHYF